MLAAVRPLLTLTRVISWADLILLWRRVTRITSTSRHNLLLATPAVAAPLVARSVHGRRLMAGRAGRSWRVLRAARSETAGAVEATITRTGTTRESRWIRIIPTAYSSIRSTSGSRLARELPGTISPAAILTAAQRVLCTWTSTLL